MQYKKNVKIIIDKRKLDLLIRLNCPKEILFDAVINNKITKIGDGLIDDTLESLIDIKEFKNWGGNHNPTGKNQHSKKRGQVDLKVDLGQNIGQVVDKDIDIDKDNKINNNIPTKKQVEEYANIQLCKHINANEFMQWYDAQGWVDNNGLPINWRQKVQSWVKRNKIDVHSDISSGDWIKELEKKYGEV